MAENNASGALRFSLLDGIRGLAALFIALRHTVPYWTFGFDRSYLAVDLFFLLSGFVIAQAYDEKLRTGAMRFRDFVVVRLIRMYPVYLFSLVLCLVVWFDRLPVAGVPLLTALVFVPWPIAGSIFLFALNGPYWSLAFELAANFLYASIRRWLGTAVLAVIVVAAGAGVAVLAFWHGSVDAGWTWGIGSYLGGAARALFGVFFGLLLHRFREPLTAVVGRFLGPWVAFGLVAVALAIPSFDSPLDPAVELVLIYFVFPVALLAASRYTGGRGEKFALFLGAASFPLYVLHEQIGLIVQYLTGHLVTRTAPWSGFVFLSLLVVFCVVLERRFDLPVRRWLRTKLVGAK